MKIAGGSRLELHLESRLAAYGIPFEREFLFDPSTKSRADFRLLNSAKNILVECEGGTWNGGRHTRGAGFARDCKKYNRAQLLGFMVYRFTSDQILSDEAILFLLEVMKKYG